METVFTILVVAGIISTVGLIFTVAAYLEDLDGLMGFAFILLFISALLTWIGLSELEREQKQQTGQECIDAPRKAIVFEGEVYILQDGK